jgi:ATP synthase protein I
VAEQPESPSPLSVGLEWASRITTIGLEFVLPMVLGYGVDSWLRTTPVGTVAGAVLGFALGMWQTIRMTRRLPGQSPRTANRYRDVGGRRDQSGDAGPL